MSYTSVRTQIYLPRDLREEIDKQRLATGESLAEYLRKAAQRRVEMAKNEKAQLKKLARGIVGAAKGTRTNKEVKHWLKEIREERKIADDRLEERWQQATKA